MVVARSARRRNGLPSTHTREFNSLLLSFLALKMPSPLNDFVSWRDGWLGRGPKEPDEFRRFLSIAEIADDAMEHIEYLADAEDVAPEQLSLRPFLDRIRNPET